MNTKRTFTTFILLALLLTACASAATPIIEEMVEYEAKAPGEVIQDAQPEPKGQDEPSDPAVDPGEGNAPGSPGQLAYEPVGNKMVIKDAELEILVQSTDVAIAQVNQLTADYGGYIISRASRADDG